MTQQEERKPNFVVVHEYDIDVTHVDKYYIHDHVYHFLIEKGYTPAKANELGQKAQWQYNAMERALNGEE